MTVTPNPAVTGGQLINVTSGNLVSSGTLNTTIKYLQVYGSFMLNILSAKSDTAVEAALDELLPQDAYKLKNAPAFTVALSAFPGLWLGGESVQVYRTDATGNPLTTQPKINKTAFAPGVYLPIGIDLNIGNKAKKSTLDQPRYNSWGLLFQVLDLGAVLSYRLNGDQSISTSPNISFKQVLSPGLGFTHHFTNSPLVFGGGVNYAPELRQVTQAGTSYSANSLRYGLFLTVDVTFFNLTANKFKK